MFTAGPSASVRLGTARLVSDLLAPAPVASVLLLVAACRGATTLAEGAAMGVLVIACATAVPTLYIECSFRRGRLSDRRLSRREERAPALVVGMLSVLAAWAVLVLIGAAHDLERLLVAMASVLALALGVTVARTLSMHAATMAGAVVIVGVLFGGAWLALAPLLALVGWARVELGEHTAGQVVLGVLVGGAGAGAAYALVP